MSELIEIDAIGLLCPLPVLKARKRLKALSAGDQVCLLADDPAAIVDVPHFCAESGYKLVSTTQADTHTAYLIEKS